MSEEKKMEALPVAGYTAQSSIAVDTVNKHKLIEESILKLMDFYKDMPDTYDGRWVAIARTQMEQAFMALNRAVFKPERVKI